MGHSNVRLVGGINGTLIATFLLLLPFHVLGLIFSMPGEDSGGPADSNPPGGSAAVGAAVGVRPVIRVFWRSLEAYSWSDVGFHVAIARPLSGV